MRRLTVVFLCVYALLITYSILTNYVPGLPRLAFMTQAITLTGFSFALLHAIFRFGWKRALILWALTFGVSLFFECVGVATGMVYGPYHYTDKLGVKFMGLVPLLIPAAWFMMMYPSLLIAGRLTGGGGWLRLVAVAALGGMVMTAWDLAMDPLMVASGHWVWEVQGAYFGVPLQNYWGWWLTTFVTFALFLVTTQSLQILQTHPAPAFDRLVVISYTATGLSSILVGFRTGMGGPALVGLFAMLPWVTLGWKK